MCQVSVINGELSQAEIDAYLAHIREEYGRMPNTLVIDVDDEYVNLDYQFYQPFTRIRRITGYLVGSLDRFNDGKRAEERDRVKHH